MSVAKRLLFEKMAQEDEENKKELKRRAKEKKISVAELEIEDALDEALEKDHT